MATHGEKRWPPTGRFNGRLRGAFHGHRQTQARRPTVAQGLRMRHSNAFLERVDQVEQLVALPDATPLALVEPLQDSGELELLQSLTNRNVRLACERLGDRDIDHGLLGQRTDELPDSGVPAWLAEFVEPG